MKTKKPALAPQEPRHVGPYYGSQLRRVIEPPPEESLVDRISQWWEDLPIAFVWIISCAVVVAVFLAALIVTLV